MAMAKAKATKKEAAKYTEAAPRLERGLKLLGKGAVCPRCGGTGKGVTVKGDACHRCGGMARIVQLPRGPKVMGVHLRTRLAEEELKVLLASLRG